MKKLLVLVMALGLIAATAFAQDTMEGPTKMILEGYIIDNMCAETQPEETLESFVRVHTKECALMPACVASGYSIYSDGELIRFDRDSNYRIEEFLKQPDSGLYVEVEAERAGDELKLVSIRNR